MSGKLEEYLGSLGPRPQADLLLDFLRQPGTLLILDGFERALRAFSSMMAAYQGDEVQESGDRGQESDGFRPSSSVLRHSDRDCVSPVAEHFLRSLATLPGIRGKVLMTTRLRPRIVEGHGEELLLGCCERELTQMDPADAVAFFRGQGIRGARAEIEAACAPYGYHPLSLRLLAGLIANDLRQPGDIAAARRLDVSGDLIQRQHHVLEQAYESLTPDRRRLLSRIACFRGPVGYEALAALADDGRGEARPRPTNAAREDAGDAGEETSPLRPGRGFARPPLPRPAPPRPQNQPLRPPPHRPALRVRPPGRRRPRRGPPPPARLLRRGAAAGAGADAGRPGARDRAVPPHGAGGAV